jgi:hypothetical protein
MDRVRWPCFSLIDENEYVARLNNPGIYRLPLLILFVSLRERENLFTIID